MDELALQLHDGTVIVVPRMLDAITTYVLLEQEAWFEKEARFVPQLLSPGATVLDIGANLGVYSLPMARRVGPTGRVFAYEPAGETRAWLEKSVARNGLTNLEIVAAALSNKSGDAHLGHGHSSELHSLGAGGAGESVRVATLDEEQTLRQWNTVDFIKIDAEGEETRILEGGRDFFARHSPIVMFEVRSGPEADGSIASAFRAIGYDVFRVLNDAPLLVPVDSDESLDRYELNLFAVKPERAAALARDGLLLREAPPPWTPDELARSSALTFVSEQKFAAAFPQCFANPDVDPLYRSALAGYAIWRGAKLPAAERYGALLFAVAKMNDVCQMGVTPARLSTMARVAYEAGRVSLASKALEGLRQLAQRGQAKPAEPFWPALPRFDGLAPGNEPELWFAVQALEQHERLSGYSSLFTSATPERDWLTRQKFASIEMERRRILCLLRTGQRLPVPERLLHRAPDHLNAEVWRKGLVPNSLAVRI